MWYRWDGGRRDGDSDRRDRGRGKGEVGMGTGDGNTGDREKEGPSGHRGPLNPVILLTGRRNSVKLLSGSLHPTEYRPDYTVRWGDKGQEETEEKGTRTGGTGWGDKGDRKYRRGGDRETGYRGKETGRTGEMVDGGEMRTRELEERGMGTGRTGGALQLSWPFYPSHQLDREKKQRETPVRVTSPH